MEQMKAATLSGKKKKKAIKSQEERKDPSLNLGDSYVKQSVMENLDEGGLFEGLPFFLKPEFRKDKEGRRPDDPLYDETTLYVP